MHRNSSIVPALFALAAMPLVESFINTVAIKRWPPSRILVRTSNGR